MRNDTRKRSVTRVVAASAVALSVAAGSYGIANAATGSANDSSNSNGARSAPSAEHPWGGQRTDETPLTGETAAKVRQAALAKVGGGTVERVETDADGHAAYEAHIVKHDGTPTTVYVDKQFNVVGVDTR